MCKGARANMIPDNVARDPGNALTNNAILISSTDKAMQSLHEGYRHQRHAPLFAADGANNKQTRMYACDRIYLLSYHAIPANTEIFLSYGDGYGAPDA